MEIMKLNDNQARTLDNIVNTGKIDYKELDGRAVRALSLRELVKVTENRKGTFVVPTAKGRKWNRS
jgi:hypothetical protein